MKNTARNRMLIVLIVALLVANFLLMPERVASDEPTWIPNGWHWDIIYAGTDMKAKENISIDGNFYIAYQVAKDKSQSHNDEKYHTWLIFDSKGTVVTNKDLYKKLAFTAEWSKRYRTRRDRDLKDNYEASLRDDYNKALRGLAMYEGGKVIVSVGSEIEGIIAKLIVTKGAGGVSLTSFKDIAKNVVLEKFDMFTNVEKCANWVGKGVTNSPSEVLTLYKTLLIAGMRKELVYARDATNSLIDMFNQNLTVMSYENAQKFEENFYASAMGDPALTLLNDVLPPAGWKTTFELIGDKAFEGFVGMSVTDAINDGKFFGTIFGKNAVDNPLKEALDKYNKRKLEYINAYNAEDATDIDKEGTTAYALYKDISKEYPSNNIGLNIMQDAKFVLEFKTGTSVNLNAILSDSNIPSPARAGDYVVWSKTLDDYMVNSCNSGLAGYPHNTITFKFAINSSGDFYIGSFGGTDEDHLFLFTNRGTVNYMDFNGNVLSQSMYRTPKERMLDLNFRNNYLGWILADTYKQLYNDNAIASGPSNYFELYNSPAYLENNTGKKVVVIDSYLQNEQEDYSWYNQLRKPIDNALNKMWSPIANNVDQDTNLSRSFDISYSNVSGSFLCITVYTDNRMHGDTTIYGLNNPPNYTSSGTNCYGNTWSITYNKSDNSYNVHNSNSASATVYLENQYPNHVDMACYTTWSHIWLHISIAIFGDDITATDLSESPSHDDGNPAPHKLIINPGLNK